MLHELQDLDVPSGAAHSEMMPRMPEPLSKFSLESDDEHVDDDEGYEEYTSSNSLSSPLSFLSRRTRRHARRRERSLLSLIPRTYPAAEQARRYAAPRGASRKEKLRRPRQRQQKSAIKADAAVLIRRPDKLSLGKALSIAVICIAHLCARVLAPLQMPFIDRGTRRLTR
ncbi:hypothetical protein SAMD00023353_11800210 [Rosellinia necatrix]|uniref:Uncharacterized protein n=1 Tax=Rosellinia necatrix TaxID=77044 RepID=A0A1S8ABE3_ROSNE|nr:hypothetical protein SAMD00023353_11800210 [Rosellinia necatrix]